jgi:hypothetical protein
VPETIGKKSLNSFLSENKFPVVAIQGLGLEPGI